MADDIPAQSMCLNENDIGRPVIQIRNLTIAYGSFKAIDNMNLDIYSEVVTCLLGHNGAGKTTLMNTICGIVRPTIGDIYLNGKDIWSGPEVLAGNIGYCSSKEVLYMDMTVSEYLMFVALIKCVDDPMPHVCSVLAKCELLPYAGQKIKFLSGGTKRRASIAASVIGNPNIIFLDEPSSGVDPENRRKIWNLIESFKGPDSAIILTTHHLEEAEYLSEDCIMMAKGKVTCRKSPKELINQFGFGYRLKFENLDNLTKEDICETIKELVPEATVEDADFDYNSTFNIIIPTEAKPFMGQIMQNLEELKIQCGIDCGSLDEAFVTMSEQENVLKLSFNEIKQELEDLFSVKYKPTFWRSMKALIYRKLAIFFTNPIQILLFIYIYFLPLVGIWVISERRLFMSNFYLSPVIIALTYVFVCSFYAELPFIERKKRIRYWLKMNGISSVAYYLSMFILDSLMSWFIITSILVTQLYVWRNHFAFILVQASPDIISIIIQSCLWSSSFIAQSYFFSMIISRKNKDASTVPFLIMITFVNFVFVLGTVNSQLREQEIKLVLTVIFALGPSTALAMRCFYEIMPIFLRNTFYAPGSLDAMNLALFIAPVIWLVLTIFLDYMRNRIKSKNVYLNDVIDKDSGKLRSKKNMFRESTPEPDINIQNLNID